MPKLAAVPDTDAAIRPRLITALGKQTRGKTLFLKWYIERASRSRPLRIFDADPHNATLARYFEGVITPGSTAMEDRRISLEQQITEQRTSARDGAAYDAIWDMGGGDLLLQRLAKEVRFTETVDRAGIDLFCFYMLGPNLADLEYFQTLDDAGFAPANLGLVFNQGLIPGDRNPVHAFDLTMRAPLIAKLIQRGAKPLFMPALATDCMEAVEQTGAPTFRDALIKLEMWHEMRLETWLNDAMERQLAKPLVELGWMV